MLNFAKKMPVAKALLFFSYLIIACGLGIGGGGLWMLFKFKDVNLFIYGFLILIGSLFLAALIRMFTDIGQIMFDLRLDIQRSARQSNELGQRWHQELKSQLQLQAEALNQNFQLQANTLSQDFQAILGRVDKLSQESNELGQRWHQELKSQLQLQANTLSQDLQGILGRVDKLFQESNALGQSWHQELKSQLQLQANTLSRDLQSIIDKFEKTFIGTSESIKKLAAIKDNFTQMNGDSKEMNQNIHQIRVFFERIEKHLDLKK